MTSGSQPNPGSPTASDGRLQTRPAQAEGTAPTGLQRLGLNSGRDGILYVPASYQANRPTPLALMLHGAGSASPQVLTAFRTLVDSTGFILLAPDSRRQTWDIILGQYGPDVAFIDQALAQTFSRYAIDPTHIAIGGFSDGASYALSLGIINGDLFTHVIAYSPGFMVPTMQEGSPRFFISHGTKDQVLPIDRCSRRLVPQLQRAGYDVTYDEFDGPHTVPPEVMGASLQWFTS